MKIVIIVLSNKFGIGYLLNLVNNSGAKIAEHLFQVLGAESSFEQSGHFLY